MAKNALCIGINDYPGTGSDLAGCVNDANDWAAALAAKAPRPEPVAYLCEGPVCSEPIDDLPRLLRLLRDGILTRER